MSGSTTGFNTFIVILIYDSLILLSFFAAINPLKVNKNANYLFGAFLLLWSALWPDEIPQHTDSYEAIQHISILVHFLQFLPQSFYITVFYNYTNPTNRFRPADVKYLILPATY